MSKPCIFCDKTKVAESIMQNDLCFVLFDKYPVSRGHALIIPFRHVSDFFGATQEEKLAILDLIDKLKMKFDTEFQPDGYNIGINCGEASGQTVMHLHVHLIPRYTGDVKDPRGGVRGVIPGKQKY